MSLLPKNDVAFDQDRDAGHMNMWSAQATFDLCPKRPELIANDHRDTHQGFVRRLQFY
jgi:hypothetical protein